MKQIETSTKVAGIDVGKAWLDVAIHGISDTARLPRSETGIGELIAALTTQGVGRVGLEASGGYEKPVVAALHDAGFEVVLHQPLEIRLFARLKRRRAKNDRLDAALVAAATVHAETLTVARLPLLQELAERLTAYEQIADQLASMKGVREHLSFPDIIQETEILVRTYVALKLKLAAKIIRIIKADPELARRYSLLQSLPGVGPIVAAALLIRMPELGSMRKGQAAALIGVAPFDHDSGAHKGQRIIAGGRARPRRMLYIAAIVAKRFDPQLKAFADRLKRNGKPPKLTIVAVMRKIVEAANLVLARQTPWLKVPA
jgi:transposase